MDKQSKAPGVYRVILCVLTLALAPVFYAIWQPYNTCLLQLPAAGGAWQLLTRLLYYVLFSLLLAGICRSSLGSKTVAPLCGQALAAHRRWRAGGQIGSRFGDLWRVFSVAG